jgi:hypothetical protein
MLFLRVLLFAAALCHALGAPPPAPTWPNAWHANLAWTQLEDGVSFLLAPSGRVDYDWTIKALRTQLNVVSPPKPGSPTPQHSESAFLMVPDGEFQIIRDPRLPKVFCSRVDKTRGCPRPDWLPAGGAVFNGTSKIDGVPVHSWYVPDPDPENDDIFSFFARSDTPTLEFVRFQEIKHQVNGAWIDYKNYTAGPTADPSIFSLPDACKNATKMDEALGALADDEARVLLPILSQLRQLRHLLFAAAKKEESRIH